MPNLDPWINQYENENHHTITEQEEGNTNKFEKYLLSIRDERQKMIRPKSHSTYNERHEKIIHWIDWTLKRYRETIDIEENLPQQYTVGKKEEEKQLLSTIDKIVNELDKKREIAINNNKKSLLKDEVAVYRLEETTIEYIVFIIQDFISKLKK